MIINQLMAVLLPGIVTLKVYEKLEGEENRIQKIVKKYMKALLIINLLSYLIVVYVFKINDFIFTNQFTIKYIILSIIIAVVYPIIEKLIRTNIGIGIEVEKRIEEKN